MRETGKLIKLLSEASNWILDAAETKAQEAIDLKSARINITTAIELIDARLIEIRVILGSEGA